MWQLYVVLEPEQSIDILGLLVWRTNFLELPSSHSFRAQQEQ